MKYYSLGLELVVLNLALIIGGYFLDDYLKSSPILILLGALLATAGTIVILLKRLK
ncbi:MAG: AtpZ/AtpI family protein [Cyclobacteriaceae bacterium]